MKAATIAIYAVALKNLELYDQSVQQIEIGLDFFPESRHLNNFYPEALKYRDDI
jgi:hypothetical protein